jgi:hypothetical protein
MTDKKTGVYSGDIKVQMNGPYTPRFEDLNGRPQIIVPVIMMKEGVHYGSAGPVFHPAEELSKFTGAWNGIPVVIQHPSTDVSPTGTANIPQYCDQIVGKVFNTTWDGGLRAEAWFDAQALEQVSPDTMALLKAGQPIDVSVGVFTDDEPSPGEWNGETYSAVSRNHRPDHLAILPGADGACSWADGCGVRTNKKGDGMKKKEGITAEAIVTSMAPSVREKINLNEDGILKIVNALRDKLNAMDTDSRYHYLEEVFADSFIYNVIGNRIDEYYRRSYLVAADGTVEIGADPVLVRKKVDYEDVKQNINAEEGDTGMTQKNEKPCCKEKVALLVGSGAFPETDHDALAGLPESVIDGIVALADKATAPAAGVQANAQQLTPEAAVQVLKDQIKTPEQFISLAPPEFRAALEHGTRLYKQHRSDLEAQVLTGCGGAYTPEEVHGLSDAELERTMRVIAAARPATYTVMAAGGVQSNGGPEPLLPAGVKAA